MSEKMTVWRMFRQFWVGMTVVFGGLAGPVHAQIGQGDTCLAAARYAAQNSKVPLAVLQAITKIETGRTVAGHFAPWPWAMNVAGDGFWHPDRQTAQAHAQGLINAGRRNFDIGCFQINYRWHGDQFRDLEHMMDPRANAAYAAAFLTRLYRETGDWSAAAGAYHSRTPGLAARYRARFEAQLRESPAPADTQLLRVNSFPLLQSGHASGERGSLVPLGNGGS